MYRWILSLSCGMMLACTATTDNGGGGGGTPVFTSIRLLPALFTLSPGGTQTITASCRDQFSQPYQCPTLAWSETGGSRQGSATPDTTGLYTAGGTTGIYDVTASAAGIAGVATITIAPVGAAPNVVVDTTTRFQTMTGWEITPFIPPLMSVSQATAMIHDAVTDMGITRVRLQATGNRIETTADPFSGGDAGPAAVNDNGNASSLNSAGFVWTWFDQRIDQIVLPMRQLVLARGEPFFLNTCYVGFSATTAFQQNTPSEYAEFAVTVLHHLQDTYGLIPDIWETRLEPDNANGYVVNGGQMGLLINAAATRAAAEGFTALRFAAPSVLNATKAPTYLTDLLAVSGAGGHVGEISYHRYSTAPSNTVLAGLAGSAAAIGANTAMLEKIGADVNVLYTDLTVANVSSWQQFALSGAPTTDNGEALYLVNVASSTYSLSSRARYLRQFFRYIRPGQVRVAVSSTNSVVKPVAFQRPAGGAVVVANTTGAATLQVGGLAAGTYTPSFTTATQTDIQGAPITISAGQTLTTSIPAAGTISITP